jgi:hypothetical protein
MRTQIAGRALGSLMGVMIATGAFAQTGSNIGLTEYPGPKCAKPQKPVPPGSQPGLDEGPAAVDAYNAKVRHFNDAVKDYNQAVADFDICMKAYIDNGNADMTRIKQRLDQAVIEANMP